MKYSICFLLFPFLSFAQTMAGRTYEAQISASCSETTTGGFMTYSYCVLSFSGDEVTVSSYSLRYGDVTGRTDWPEKKVFKYEIKDETIYMKDFPYGNLRIVPDQLIGKKEMNYGEYVDLAFSRIE